MSSLLMDGVLEFLKTREEPRLRMIRWADPGRRFDGVHPECSKCWAPVGWTRPVFDVMPSRWVPVTVVMLDERAAFLLCDSCNDVSLLEAGEDEAMVVSFSPGEEKNDD